MFVNVKFVTGVIRRYFVDETDSIYNIKRLIQRREGISIENQHILYKDRETKDKERVCDLDLRNDSVLNLVINMKGGPFSYQYVSEENSFASANDSDIEEMLDSLENINGESVEDKPMALIMFQSDGKIQFYQPTVHSRNGIFDSLSYPKQPVISSEQAEQNIKTQKTVSKLRLKMDMNKLSKRLKKLYDIHTDVSSNIKNKSSQHQRPDTNNMTSASKLTNVLSSSQEIDPKSKGKSNNFSNTIPKADKEHAVDSNVVRTIRSFSINAVNGPNLSRVGSRLLEHKKCTVKENTFRAPTFFHQKSVTLCRPTSALNPISVYKKMKSNDVTSNNKSSVEGVNSDILTAFTDAKEMPFNDVIEEESPIVLHYDNTKSSLLTKSKILPTNKQIKYPLLPPINGNEVPPLTASKQLPQQISKKKSVKKRCGFCNCRLNLINCFNCRCGVIFCATHRYPEAHKCGGLNNYFGENKKAQIQRDNPLVIAKKVPDL